MTPVSPVPPVTLGRSTYHLKIGIAEHGRTLTASRMVKITLTLPDRWRWELPRIEGAAMGVIEVVSDQPTGSQIWELTPRGIGSAKLSTHGAPACQPGAPGCSTRPRDYTVTFDLD